MNASQLTELFIPKEGNELKLLEDNAVQVIGCIKNPLSGPATIVLLLIQPNQCPIMKSVNLEIKEPETKKEEKKNLPSLTEDRGENAFPTQITIQIIREYSEGTLSRDVLIIQEGT